MDLARELVLQRREEIDELMRLVPALRVAELAVDQFLEDEVPLRVVGEVGGAEHDLEVRDMAVQVAGHEHFRAVRKVDDMAAPAGRGADQRESLAEVCQHSVRGGHGWLLGSKSTIHHEHFTNNSATSNPEKCPNTKTSSSFR